MFWPHFEQPLYGKPITDHDSDATALISGAKFLYVGGTGDLHITQTRETATLVIEAVPAGAIIPICASWTRLIAATTATKIIAFF